MDQMRRLRLGHTLFPITHEIKGKKYSYYEMKQQFYWWLSYLNLIFVTYSKAIKDFSTLDRGNWC